MGGIYWTEFNWESFATILTGVLAVGAAAWVGVRQTRILEGQIDLAELSHRHDLFDRRYGVYVDVRDFLYSIVTNGAYPERDIEIKFFQAIGLSRFYFGDFVYDRLEAMRRETAAYALLKHEMDRTFGREGHFGVGNPEKEKDLFQSIYDRLQGLPELFGDALRLGD